MNHSLILFTVVSCLTLIWLSKSQRPDLGNSLTSSVNSEPILTKSEEAKLKGCFPWSVYYLQKIEYRSPSIVCHGNLRYLPPVNMLAHKTATELAYELINKNIQASFGDRFLLLLQEDNPDPDQPDAKYTLTLVPNFRAVVPFQGWAATLPTVVLVIWVAPHIWLWVVMILLIRECTRHLVAKYHQIKITLPYLVAQLLGLLWYRSHIPNRKVLFDLAIAPNLITVLISMPLLIWGLVHSSPVADHSFNPQSSLLVTGLLQVLTWGKFDGAAIDLNTAAWVGGAGLLIAVASLMPVGLMDGGHLVHSLFGQKKAAIASSLSRLFILALGLISQPWLLVIAIQLFFISENKSPILDEVTDVNLVRYILGIAMLVLMLLVILPVPRFR